MKQTAQQDYLKAIYQVSKDGAAATTSQLAARLNVRAASVTHMLKKLSNATPPLVHYQKHHGVTLTGAGRRAALHVVRRHRLIETFLYEKLDFGWDEVHEEAERLEHAISPELVLKIASALGDPTHDPHGQPIPSAALTVVTVDERPLAALALGEPATVTRVRDEDASLLRYFAKHNVRPGTQLCLKTRQPNGSLLVQIEQRTVEIQPLMTNQIFVTAKK